MAREEQQSLRRTHAAWHLWVFGVVMLVLYLIGARDYVLTHMQSEEYFADLGYGQAQIDYFTDYPVPLAIVWAINLVTGLAAAVLLLLRLRWATGLALSAAVSQLILMLVTFGFMNRWEILGPRLSIVDVGVWVLTAGLWLYCRAMRRRRVLR